jgi:hypothetical protein
VCEDEKQVETGSTGGGRFVRMEGGREGGQSSFVRESARRK